MNFLKVIGVWCGFIAALAGRGRNGSVAGTEFMPLDARRIETANHRARTRLKSVLDECGRRVLEDARARKRRSNPDRVQGRDKTKLQGRGRGGDERCGRGLLIAAGSDERHRTFMPGSVRIGVDEFMPLRQNTQRKSRDECCESNDGNPGSYSAKMQLPLHRLPDCPDDLLIARRFPKSGLLSYNVTRDVGAQSRSL